jgi:hypothetical protein
MGGAAGHLLHLSEDLQLTFGELKDVFLLAAEGKLERVTEKLDGMNLVFTWNEESKQLSAARTPSDIKKGGMDASQLAAKFKDRGNVADAFNSAFAVLRDAVDALPARERMFVFGPSGQRWFSMEVIYSLMPNIINYDRNSIVFHGVPTFELRNNKVENVDNQEAVDVLAKNVDTMQKAVQQRSWRVSGPAIVNLKKLATGEVVDKAIEMLNNAQARVHIGDDDTLHDYLVAMARADAEAMGISGALADDLALRVASVPGAPNVVQLKKRAGAQADTVVDVVSTAPERIKSYMEPVEAAIFELSLEVLRGVSSVLVGSRDEELRRLKSEVNNAIKAIRASGNEAAMNVLQAQMSRLSDVDRISSTVEGVVFIYKGKAYKFTGSFTPVHRILSLFRFGRGGVKLEAPPVSEAWRRWSLVEGGKAFDKARPIKIDDYGETLSSLRHDLEDLGASRIEPIGSTGKKQLMGDIDVAVEFDGGAAELFDLASAVFGSENVKKVGGNVVSVLYPVHSTRQHVQVDLMVGDVGYLSWARAGSSTTKGHPDYSAVKGVVRNLLLNTISRFVSERVFTGKTTQLDRTRYAIDFDRGLFKIVQRTRR